MSAALKRVLARLPKARREGDQWVAPCPNHDDSEPSLSVAEKNGKVLLHCFGGCSTKDVVAALGLEWSDLFADGSNDGLTLQEYAEAKKLPLPFLQELGLTESRYAGRARVCIPYYGVDGDELAFRYRCALVGKGRFRWRRGSKPALYGLWRLVDARAEGSVILVEGESDAQTLWYRGFPAVGIPGASSWREDWAGTFDGIKRIYVVKEPDKGGDTLVEALSGSRLRDRIEVVSL